MTPAIAHRIPRPLSVLTALAVLSLSAPFALLDTPGHAAPMDDDSSNPGLEITSDIVIKSDDTYSFKVVMTDNSGFGIISEDHCNVDDLSQSQFGKNSKNAKATFKEDGDSAICTIEGSVSIKDSDGAIKHQGSEYVVKIGTDEEIGDMSQLDVTQSITFPGKVTEADGGKVDGNKVTFTDVKSHTVKGGDGSIPMWVWIIVGVGALALIGGLAAFFVIRSKKNKTQAPYGTPVQSYDPNQPFPAQPGQQAGYGAPRLSPVMALPTSSRATAPPRLSPVSRPATALPAKAPTDPLPLPLLWPSDLTIPGPQHLSSHHHSPCGDPINTDQLG